MALLKRKRAGLSDPMSVVTRFINACNRHDADAIFSCLHPSFDSIQPMFPSRNFRGADQVRRNWQAIFDAEPGFRLTVLRAAVVDDIVWLELHGAGQDAEVAGVFVMGIQGDRIRWARIYSALVEPVPAAADGQAAVATHDGRQAGDDASIAPVVDIERSGRRRRRRGRRGEPERAAEPEAAVTTEAEPAVAPDAVVEPELEFEPEAEGEPAAEVEPEAVIGPEPAVAAEPEAVVEPETLVGPGPGTTVEPEPEPVIPIETEPEAVTEPEPEVLVKPATEPEPAPPPQTAAHDMVTELSEETGPEPAADPEDKADEDTGEEPEGDAPRWRFGKKSR